MHAFLRRTTNSCFGPLSILNQEVKLRTGKKDDPKRDVPAAKAVKKPSKKKREDWDKIEFEVGDDWDSVKEGFKAKMAAAKGTSAKNRKSGPIRTFVCSWASA